MSSSNASSGVPRSQSSRTRHARRRSRRFVRVVDDERRVKGTVKLEPGVRMDEMRPRVGHAMRAPGRDRNESPGRTGALGSGREQRPCRYAEQSREVRSARRNPWNPRSVEVVAPGWRSPEGRPAAADAGRRLRPVGRTARRRRRRVVPRVVAPGSGPPRAAPVQSRPVATASAP